MLEKTEFAPSPVTIDTGLQSWQILQQDPHGVADATISGTWWTICKRRKPEVRVRVTREGGFVPVTKRHDWIIARTQVDRSIKGEAAGKSGTWTLTVRDIPCGGPYRVQTTVGSAEDAIEWRRSGEAIHFFGVGDIWLIAGQSNAEGYGRDPVDDPSEIGIQGFYSCNGWQLAAHDYHHSPWIFFAKALKKELGYPIGLIPTAVGGSSMSQWTPGRHGTLYDIMKQRLRNAGSSIRGCIWYQGESDCQPTEHSKYRARFARFVAGLRTITKQPTLPVITVQLNRVLGPGTDGRSWETVREIQRRIAGEDAHVHIIPIFEAGLCDGIHLSSHGNQLVAERAATTALGGVYGRDLHYRHPECTSARQVTAKSVELCFANVITRLDYGLALEHGFPFVVRDDSGEVPVAGYKLTGRDRFRIELKRSLRGSATVTGAPGACPPQIVPFDINGYRGMLGFTISVSQRPRGSGTA